MPFSCKGYPGAALPEGRSLLSMLRWEPFPVPAQKPAFGLEIVAHAFFALPSHATVSTPII